MKIFLDDERTPPDDSWTLVPFPEDVIEHLKAGKVTAISLDHDLGDDERNGYDVLLWIERAVVEQNFIPPVIHIHTANPPARQKMELALSTIKRLAEKNELSEIEIFENWLANNISRFKYPPVITRKNEECIYFRFKGVSSLISGSFNRWGMSIFVNYEKELWDFLYDFEIYEERNDEGYYCSTCMPEFRVYYQSREELYIKHSFEHLLDWCNEKFIPENVIFLRRRGGSTWAQIESMKTAKKLLEQYREETGEVIAIQPIVLDKCTEQELNEAEEHDLYSFQNEFSKLEKSFQSVKEALESGDMVTESDVNKISNNADTFCNTFSEQRCRTKNGRDFSEATPEEMEYLDKLNLKFAELQNLTYFKITEIKNQLKKQIAEGDAFLKDYEVFPEVSFILNENDPLCDDDSDNIIAHCNWHHFEECLAEAGLDWNQKDPDKLDCNWNDFSHCKDSPFYQKHHCHLFHALLDHIFPSLSLDDVLRIGDINIDIKVEHQTFLELDLKT